MFFDERSTCPDRQHRNERRVLAVIRWPVGGIRSYLLYTYPHLLEAGYRFSFVVPADSFRAFAEDIQDWPETEIVEAPVRGRKCHLRSTIRRLLRERRFSLIHSHGLTAAIHCALANLGLGVPHIITSHDVIRVNQFPGILGRVKRAVIGRLLSLADRLVTVSQDAHANHLYYFLYLQRCPEKV